MSEKSMNEQSKNIAIGSVVIIAIALLTSILLFLHPSFGDEKIRLHAKFASIDKISVGSRVSYAGRAVGKVLHIEHLPRESAQPASPNAPIYIYDLLLGIDSSVALYDCDEISIGTSGLMGERYISITPKHPKNRPARLLSANETILAHAPIDAQETFTKIASAVSNIERITSVLNATEGLEHLIKSATTMCNTINDTSETLHELATQISAGEGSVGKLLANDDFYTKSVALVNRLDLLMSDVNRYGVLFHLNKSWQRESKERTDESTAVAKK